MSADHGDAIESWQELLSEAASLREQRKRINRQAALIEQTAAITIERLEATGKFDRNELIHQLLEAFG